MSLSCTKSTCFWYLGIGAFISKWQGAETQNMLLTEKKELLHYKNRSFTFSRILSLRRVLSSPRGGLCGETRGCALVSQVSSEGALLCGSHVSHNGHSHETQHHHLPPWGWKCVSISIMALSIFYPDGQVCLSVSFRLHQLGAYMLMTEM